MSTDINGTKKLMGVRTYSVLDGDPVGGFTNAKLMNVTSGKTSKANRLSDEMLAINMIKHGLGVQYCTSSFQERIWMSHRIAFLEQQLMKLDKDGYNELYSRNRGDK